MAENSQSSSPSHTTDPGGAVLGPLATPPAGGEAGKRTPADDVQLLLDQAEEALASVNQPASLAADTKPFEFRQLNGAPASEDRASLELLQEVELELKIELGRTQMYLADLLKLKKGSVVTLDKLAGDPVDVYVNGRLIARGEVLVMNDNFCVRVAELVSGDELD